MTNDKLTARGDFVTLDTSAMTPAQATRYRALYAAKIEQEDQAAASYASRLDEIKEHFQRDVIDLFATDTDSASS